MKIGITERGDACFHEWHDLHGCDGMILISKNIDTLRKNIHPSLYDKVIIHATITGWGNTNVEPNVLDSDSMMKVFNNELSFLNSSQAVLRIDPIVPTEKGLEKAISVISKLERECRIRISFLDAYNHVRDRFKNNRIDLIDWHGLHQDIDIRKQMLNDIEQAIGRRVEVCGEPNMECTGCVSKIDLQALNINEDIQETKSPQRYFCKCLGVKKELLKQKEPCPHGCLYCYWKDN
jgi:hypothetical protein